MVTQQALYLNNSEMSKSLEKLSTGLRINRAQDDAAGLAMSEQMRSQIRGLGKAKQNAQDGIAALQIAEGGLAEVTNMIQRQRELAIQAATDTVTSTERSYLDYEFKQLTQEINRIAATTDYNTINMLNQFGSDGSAGRPAALGTLHLGANSTVSPGLVAQMDPAANAAKITYSISVVGNTGNILNRTAANTAIDQLSSQLKGISGMRANIGSFINRLEYTVNNIASLEYNTQDAESRIRDTDFGKETTNFTRNQILVQSATSMLAQANSLPQSVLGLLG
jgi:flagellin